MAHRMVYEELTGKRIPAGVPMDHLCRNPSCVNPGHLEVVTTTENVRRSRATKLTIEQVIMIKTDPDGATDVARKYGVTPSNISHIRHGDSWKDVP